MVESKPSGERCESFIEFPQCEAHNKPEDQFCISHQTTFCVRCKNRSHAKCESIDIEGLVQEITD